MAGSKLVARKRRGRIQQKKKGEIAALDRGLVGRIVEGLDRLDGALDGKQATMLARIGLKNESPPLPEGYLI